MQLLKIICFSTCKESNSLFVDIWLYAWKTRGDITLIYKSNTEGGKKPRNKFKKCLTPV